MPGATELAGTIGTWVAVFLAIVALAGVLPAYVLFRRSRTARGQALASVDDRDQDFVSHSFSLMGTRINQRVKVPDLRYPPSEQVFGGCQNIDTRKLRSCDSTTCWVNFAHLMQTMFPTVRSSTGEDALRFEDNQSYLPVHFLWLILFGVAHRYAYRKDYGLPLGVLPHEHTRGRDVDYHVAGRSGILLRRDAEIERSSAKLYFEAHPLNAIKEALRQDSIQLRILILRFLGYIRLSSDRYIKPSEVRFSNSYASNQHSSFSTRARIAKFISGQVLQGDKNILRNIGLELDNTAFVYIQLTSATHTTNFGERAKAQKLLPQHLLRSGYVEIGDWKLSSFQPKASIWMERQEVQRSVMEYLRVEMSVNSFLYNTSRDMIARKLLKGADFFDTLDMVKGTLNSLQLADDTRLTLQRTIAALSDTDVNILTWSRHTMQSLYALDRALEIIATAGGFKWETISILYAYDTEFRSMLRHVARQGRSMIRFQVDQNYVSFQTPESLPDVHSVAFDFQHVFSKEEMVPEPVSGDMSTNEAVLAALQGHVRSAMWKLCLSPAGLLDVYTNRTDDEILLGASPARNLLRPRLSPHPDLWPQGSTTSDGTHNTARGYWAPRDTDRARASSRPSLAFEDLSDISESLEDIAIDDYDGLLHIAAFEGDKRLLRLLLEMGADINSERERFGSALQAASYSGRRDVVQDLIRNGADVDAQGGRHRNPLGAALRKGHAEVVQLLLDHGATFGDRLPVQHDTHGLTVTTNRDEDIHSGAGIDSKSEVEGTDLKYVADSESSKVELGSITASSGDQGPNVLPSLSIDISGLPHYQSATLVTPPTCEEQLAASQLTEDQELFLGEILDVNGVLHALRLLHCNSGAIRLEGRSLDSTKESLPDWTAFLTYFAAARDVDFFHIETGSIVSMVRPKSGVFCFGSNHRLSLDRNNLFVLPFRRREDASDLISQWRKLCCQGQVTRAGRAASVESLTRSSQDIV